MQPNFFLRTAILAAVARADFSIDANKGDMVASENAALVASITANPVFQSDVSALAAVAPSSVIAALAEDPEAVINALLTATGLPTTATALPTDALDSLASVAAIPIEIAEDIASYISAAIAEPAFVSAQSVIATALPPALQSVAAKEDPGVVLANLITASGTPAYITAFPTDVQTELAHFINGGLDIIASDLAAPAPSIPRYNSTPSMTVSVTGKNTSAPVGTGTPAPFTGAANVINSNTIVAAVIVVSTIMLVLL